MRLKILVLGTMLLAAVPVSAQTFNLGLEAGANFSNILGNASNSLSGPQNTLAADKLGFVGGGFLQLNFGGMFSIRPELLYEQKGNQISGKNTSVELDYIEIPLLARLSIGLPVINPAILLGPSFGWNTLAQAGGTNLLGINSSDIGLMAGLEFDLGKILLSGRYELGLENVQNGTNAQNGTFTVLAGYEFL
jgi:hypothetical protein